MEREDEFELTDREGGLRELRGVLSTPHRRNSRKSSISGLILGGTTGVIALIGAGGYYGLSILFPPPGTNPVRVNPDLLAVEHRPAPGDAQMAAATEVPPAEMETRTAPPETDVTENTPVEPLVVASIQPEVEGPEFQPSPPPGEVAPIAGGENAAPDVAPVRIASLQPGSSESPANIASAGASSPAGALQLSVDSVRDLRNIGDAPAPPTGPQGPALASLSAPAGSAQSGLAPATPRRPGDSSLEIASLSPEDSAPGRAPVMAAAPRTPAPTARRPLREASGATGGAPLFARATQELPGPPEFSETHEVASLDVSPRDLPDQPGAQVPAWSPLIPSATPIAPDSPQGLQGGGHSAEARQVTDIVIPGLVAAPPSGESHGPRLVVASLSEGLIYGPANDASPVPAARSVAPGTAPRAVAQIGSVRIATIDEAAPKALLVRLEPHAVSPDGAARTTVDALPVSYPGGSAADQTAGLGDMANEPVRTAPSASAPVATAVQVASISPDLMLAVGAPVDISPRALSAPADAVAIGGAPAEPQYDSANEAAPLVEESGLVRLASLEPTIADWEQAALATRLVDPAPPFDLPSTPNVTVDPDAAFSEPLDALTSTPSAQIPAPASTASLGAEPPANLYAPASPAEPGARHQDDPGRQAALNVVNARRATAPAPQQGWVDDRPAWIRNGVAPRPNPGNLPVIAIIIDEVGEYGAPLEEVRSMSPMVTTSVIPSTPDAEKIARSLRFSRREVLVHLPMEAKGETDLGPRPILTGMSDVQVRETAEWHLTQFDGYIGVDSHRGGVATKDRRVMDALMPELVKRGLIFIDSRNAKDSVAEKAAQDAGLLAASNNFFIDDKKHTNAIYRQLDAAVAYARKNGAAIAIGNPHAVTIQAVKAWMKKNDGETVMVQPLTYVTQVVNGRRGGDIIVAGTPPKLPPPQVPISEVAEKLSSSASKSIGETLSGIAADLTESLFKR